MRKLIIQFSGFSVVGIVITLFSILLLYVFIESFKLNLYISYITVYILSIAGSYFLNGKLVFKKGLSISTYFLYNLIYGSSLLIGLLSLYVFQVLFNFNDFINSLLPLPFTMTWNFLFTSKMFSRFEN